jgi:hypothetical protein
VRRTQVTCDESKFLRPIPVRAPGGSGSHPFEPRLFASLVTAAGSVESASDLVFAGYDLGGIGQDSGAEPWIGFCERSIDAFDVYGEEFQTVLKDWQGP